MTISNRPDLHGVHWEWTALTGGTEDLELPDPGKYTVLLESDGKITVKTDCNRARGTYRLDGNRIDIGPLGATRMMCPPGSQSDRFLRELQGAAVYSVQAGQLHLELRDDAGVMRFRRGYAIPDPARPQVEP